MVDDDGLAALEQQVTLGLKRYEVFVERVVNILFAVGVDDVRLSRWTLRTRSDWKRFFDDAKLADYQEVIPGLVSVYGDARRRRLVPELPRLGEPLKPPANDTSPDAPVLSPELAKYAVHVQAAHRLLLNRGYKSYFVADLAREMRDKPDNVRHMLRRIESWPKTCRSATLDNADDAVSRRQFMNNVPKIPKIPSRG